MSTLAQIGAGLVVALLVVGLDMSFVTAAVVVSPPLGSGLSPLGSGLSGTVTTDRPDPTRGDRPDLTLPGRAAPAHARLFTPRAAPPGAFRVSILDTPLVEAVTLMRRHFEPGAASSEANSERWRATRQAPLSAFGHVAPYNKSKLAQLYVDRLVEVVRVPIEQDGLVVASLTLIAPYPDPSLSRLEPGTLAILFDVAAARAHRQ